MRFIKLGYFFLPNFNRIKEAVRESIAPVTNAQGAPKAYQIHPNIILAGSDEIPTIP